MSYKKYQQTNAPPWLQNPNGTAWLGSLGLAKDDLADACRQAVKAHFPTVCPADALPLIALERQIDRGLSDSDATYGIRLQQAWDIWPLAGTPLGLLNALSSAGFTGAVIVQQNGLAYYMNVGVFAVAYLGGNPNIVNASQWWTFDASSLDANGVQFNSRFMIVFGTLSPINANQAATVKSIVAKWKPSKAKCMGVVSTTTGRLWGWPVNTWGSGGTWGGTSTFYAYP